MNSSSNNIPQHANHSQEASDFTFNYKVQVIGKKPPPRTLHKAFMYKHW